MPPPERLLRFVMRGTGLVAGIAGMMAARNTRPASAPTTRRLATVIRVFEYRRRPIPPGRCTGFCLFGISIATEPRGIHPLP
jgi:hypothetical protein